MQERKAFNPRQLTSARIARGLTIKEVAEHSEISRQAISGYESGKSLPKIDTALKIASVLNFPLDFFYDKTTILPQSTTYFRKRTSTTNKVRKMQEERLVFSVKVYEKLCTYVNVPSLKLPELVDKEISEITEGLIYEKARELRDCWGLDAESPVYNIIALAETNGVVVVETNVSDKDLDAASHWYKTRPFIILTDNSESAVRRRFNVAHELGHLILHNGIENYDDNKVIKEMEEQAHLFASAFLMPNDAFINSLLYTSLDFYKELKKYWKVSIQAMLFKTSYLHLINEDRKLYLNKQISLRRWRTKEPLDDSIEIEKPSLNKRIFQMIVENNIMSENDLISSFRLPLDELSKIIGIDFTNCKDAIKKPNTVPHLRLV